MCCCSLIYLFLLFFLYICYIVFGFFLYLLFIILLFCIEYLFALMFRFNQQTNNIIGHLNLSLRNPTCLQYSALSRAFYNHLEFINYQLFLFQFFVLFVIFRYCCNMFNIFRCSGIVVSTLFSICT